jgi:hypothetical protein
MSPLWQGEQNTAEWEWQSGCRFFDPSLRPTMTGMAIPWISDSLGYRISIWY